MAIDLKNTFTQANQAGEELKARIAPILNRAEVESKKILNGLGADLDAEDRSLKAVLARLRAHNSSLKELARNFDTATYDLRGRLNWDLKMATAYARLQAEKAYEREVRPRLDAALVALQQRMRKAEQATCTTQENAASEARAAA